MNYMYVVNTAILKLRIFSGRYYFRLWVFASTGEYFYYWQWRLLPKVLQGINDVKTFKNLGVSLYALRSQQNIRMLQKNGSHLTAVFKNHDLVLWIVGSEVIKLWVLGFQVICVTSQYHQSRSPRRLIKRTSADIELSNYQKP